MDFVLYSSFSFLFPIFNCVLYYEDDSQYLGIKIKYIEEGM
jgi:hypothetical protein